MPDKTVVILGGTAEARLLADALVENDGERLRGKVVQTFLRGEPARAGIGRAL